jgi:hypothetical protein
MHEIELPPQFESGIPPVGSPGSSPLDQELLGLLSANRKLEACKRYKLATGVRLLEAKEYVESLALRHGIHVQSAPALSGPMLMVLIVAGAIAGIGVAIYLTR